MNGTDPSDCHLDGLLADELTLMPKVLGYNCTAFTASGSQRTKEGNYTGYIGRLQADLADYSPATTMVPLTGNPVDFSPVVTADTITFTTMYTRPSRLPGDTDLLASLDQIDYLAWVVFVVLLLLIAMVLKFQRQNGVLFKVAQGFFQYTGLEGKAQSNKIFGWTVTVGFFVLSLFYANFILSQLVRQDHPKVLKSFFDVLKPEAKIRFTKEFPVYQSLKSVRNTQVRLIADRIKHEGIEKLTIPGGLDSYKLFIEPQNGRLLAVFGGHNRIKHTQRLVCTIIRKDNVTQRSVSAKKSLWIPQDSPLEYFIATVYNKKLDSDIKETLDKAIQHYAEQGFYGDIYFSRIIDIFKSALYKGDYSDEHLCHSERILVEEPELSHSINLKNADMVFLSICLAHLMALGLVMKEICAGSKKTSVTPKVGTRVMDDKTFRREKARVTLFKIRVLPRYIEYVSEKEI
ncbi:hypothetical protein HDE_02090 [Halotydeus destructor]|nr:hypothetical protein HDE_02090 [Halotydeus destructor]